MGSQQRAGPPAEPASGRVFSPWSDAVPAAFHTSLQAPLGSAPLSVSVPTGALEQAGEAGRTRSSTGNGNGKTYELSASSCLLPSNDGSERPRNSLASRSIPESEAALQRARAKQLLAKGGKLAGRCVCCGVELAVRCGAMSRREVACGHLVYAFC